MSDDWVDDPALGADATRAKFDAFKPNTVTFGVSHIIVQDSVSKGIIEQAARELTDLRAERDALAARIEAALVLCDQWAAEGPPDMALMIFNERIRDALSPQEGT